MSDYHAVEELIDEVATLRAALEEAKRERDDLRTQHALDKDSIEEIAADRGLLFDRAEKAESALSAMTAEIRRLDSALQELVACLDLTSIAMTPDVERSTMAVRSAKDALLGRTP
jgi:chromosome segregation ATPase